MSGSIRVSLGSALSLTLQVYDGKTNVFPRANVYDASFAEVAGSPFVLSHVANGLYKNSSGFTPPSSGLYYAIYTVYSDNSYATVLGRYSRANDEFDVNTLIADTLGLNDKIGSPASGSIAEDIEDSEGRTA